MTIQRHPLSALFSRFDLAGEDLKALAADIKGQGQLQKITMHDGMVLDGWNRYQACLIAKVKPKMTDLKPSVDPWAFVCSSNMHRRHMTPSERVGVMALYFQMLNEVSESDGEEGSKLTAPTVKQVEQSLDVSHGTAVKAVQIAKANTPGVAEALAGKKISLDRAAEISRLPEGERQEALEVPAPKAAPKPKTDNRDIRITQLERLLAERDQEIAELKGHLAESNRMLAEATEDNQSMDRVLNQGGDRLINLMAEVSRYKEQARIATQQNRGLMTGNADLANTAKRWKTKFEALEKKTKGQPAQDPEMDLLETREEEPSFDEVG